MVEVFKTNVREAIESERLIQLLFHDLKADKVSFDLEDCDRVLRVEGQYISPEKVIDVVNSLGYLCDVLI